MALRVIGRVAYNLCRPCAVCTQPPPTPPPIPLALTLTHMHTHPVGPMLNIFTVQSFLKAQRLFSVASITKAANFAQC